MELTIEFLQKYVGGLLVVQSQSDDHLSQGEIESVEVRQGTMRVRLAWRVQRGQDGRVGQFDELEYDANLSDYLATDSGHGITTLQPLNQGDIIAFQPGEIGPLGTTSGILKQLTTEDQKSS